MRAKREPRPTQFQSRILAQIARSPLMKTRTPDHKIVWGLQNGRAISDKCAEALIRNGWVVPQRDGLPLGMYDESQTYVALKAPGIGLTPGPLHREPHER